MKRQILAFLAAAAVALGAFAQAAFFTSPYPILTAATTTGVGPAVRGLNVNKTYEVSGTVASGTGTALVTVEGSMSPTATAPTSAAAWRPLAAVSVPLTTTTTSGSFLSFDRAYWLRGNVTVLSGSAATVNITAGY